MRVVVLKPLVAVVVACSLLSCSTSDDDSATPTSEQTWDCVVAIQSAGLSTGTLVVDARKALTRLESDAKLPEEERAFYADLHEALADLPGSSAVGSALDDVPCPAG